MLGAREVSLGACSSKQKCVTASTLPGACRLPCLLRATRESTVRLDGNLTQLQAFVSDSDLEVTHVLGKENLLGANVRQ